MDNNLISRNLEQVQVANLRGQNGVTANTYKVIVK